MPTNPQPLFDPANMPWARWASDSIRELKAAIERLDRSGDNTDDSQNSTMNMLVQRLGDVESGINAIIAAATFDASQITTGVLNDARVPTLSASKISGGSTSIGSITTSGNAIVNGHVYVPNSTIASFGSWTNAYIDGDGRLTRGASSRRFKQDINDAPTDGDYFCMPLREFRMKGGDGKTILGYIAEELVGTDAERFVVFEMDVSVTESEEEGGEPTVIQTPRLDANGDRIPFSIDFMPLIMAQNAQLKAELTATNARLAAIEAVLGLPIEES